VVLFKQTQLQATDTRGRFFAGSEQNWFEGGCFSMTRVNNKLLQSTALVALVVSLHAVPVHAQDSGDDASDPTDEELAAENTIVVSGIRGSILSSIEDKRDSGQIIDTINAEDIGRSTDQNIAEALNRVSGVSISSNDGQGTFISVRGANADQTVVTLNGTTLGSTGFSQGVDLSAYSADILSRVEVIKTPSADDEEGSLAAVVNLITRRPLDLRDDIRTVTGQLRYNDLSENYDYRIAGTFSQRFADNRLGILVTANYDTNSVQREQVSFENYNAFSSYGYTDETGAQFVAQDAIDADQIAATRNNRDNAFAGATGVQAGDGPYAPIAWGLAPENSLYEFLQNDYERYGFDASLQWEIADGTRLTLSGTYNRQNVNSRNDAVFVATQRFVGHIDGVQQPNLGLGLPFRDRSGSDPSIVLPFNPGNPLVGIYDSNPIDYGGTVDNFGDPVTNPTLNDQLLWTDPVQNWRTLDTDTRTWTQYQARHAVGGTRASVNDFKTENYLISAELEHEWSDALQMVAGASLSQSQQTPEQQIFMIANRNRTIGPWNLHHVPADQLVPAGYDCAGGPCQLIGADTDPFLGNVIEFQQNNGDLWDNVGRTGFNPDDLASHTLGFISSGFTDVEDEQLTAFADFDWEVDFAGVTSFEFGGRYTSREKFVNQQNGTPRSSGEFIEVVSPLTGQTISLDPAAINLISAANFSNGELPTNEFGSGLGLSQDSITDGWQTFDPVAALAAVSEGDRAFTLDNTQTRGAEFENWAGYAKANFEYFDGRLRGDVGLRYVRTRVDTTGFAGALFAFDNQGRGRIIDPIYLETLRNSPQNNPCPVLDGTPNPVGEGPGSQFWTNGLGTGDVNAPGNYDLFSFQERNRNARVDGQGTVPGVPGGVCYDPLLEPGALPDTYRERNLVRYSDISTEQFGTGAFSDLPDRSRASIPASDSFSYDEWLPNLNLSFLVNDEMIARLSAYRTMARPPIDDLRAGFRMVEGTVFEGNPVFRPSSTVDLYSAQVRPLTANNIDLAYEWYFERDALLSVNLFYKDINNLIETTDSRWFIGDLRRIAADPDNASFDGMDVTNADGISTPLLLVNSADTAAQPDIGQCMPRRLQGEGTFVIAEDWLFDGDPRLLCNEYNVTRRENAGSASVKGLELQYVHNYRFLPGTLSNLGIAANYTYQVGEFSESGFPIPGTPRTSYNITGFWQEGGNQLRLAWSGSGDSLIQRSFGGGALWQQGRDVLDFSAAYEVTSNVLLTFEATNLTDEPVRTYFTSRIIRLPDGTGTFVNFDEGSIYDGAPRSRTIREYNTGRNFRVGLRFNF